MLLQVFIRQAKHHSVVDMGPDALPVYNSEEEWILDTEGINLMQVSQSHIPDHLHLVHD